MLLECVRQPYSKQQLSMLWALAHDPEVHRVFFMHLRSIDTSIITIGNAPLTSVKRAAIADQAPMAIRFLVYAVQENTRAFCAGSKHISEGERMNHADVIDGFELKHRNYDTSAFQHLLGEQLQQALLLEDFKSPQTCSKVPQTHAYQVAMDHFAGQRYNHSNTGLCGKAFKKLGLEINRQARVFGKPRRCVYLPSIEGIEYLLSKKHWLAEGNDAPLDE